MNVQTAEVEIPNPQEIPHIFEGPADSVDLELCKILGEYENTMNHFNMLYRHLE